MCNANLIQEFDAAMEGLYRQIREETNYNPSRFLQMLHQYRGVETACRLIGAQTQGYTKLYLLGRLDLTVEAFIVENPKWWPLFSEDDYARSIERLMHHKYTPRINDTDA